MTLMDDIEKKHIEEWRNEVASRADDPDDFLRYFDTTPDMAANWASGHWDMAYHILKPEVTRLLGEPFGKTVLEIGYGGGRVLQAACRLFARGYGIDIHGNSEVVAEALQKLGLDNFELFQGDGRFFPLDDSCVDFVYSFIALQHLSTIDALRDNLSEAFRVLKPGGCGILYFGYLEPKLFRRKRYEDLTIRTMPHSREVTLRLSPPLAVEMLQRAGFRVLGAARSFKKPWLTNFGGQFYAMVERP